MEASTPTSTADPGQFGGRAAAKARSGVPGIRELPRSPHSPKTPTTFARSISSQFGSPGSYRAAQEDVLVYEIGARHFSAGFAGESRPRCILEFTPEGSRRVGDYRQYAAECAGNIQRSGADDASWAAAYELYRIDLRELDLGLVEDKLERALRTAMVDYLQLDAKPRKAVLVVPPTLPKPLMEVALRVIFGHFTQPPSISLFTQPVMCCVSAGLRHALVVDIGWEETVVTAVSEYKAVSQTRTVRAGKRLTREMASTLEDCNSGWKPTFDQAEDLIRRIAWCRQRQEDNNADESSIEVQLGASNTGHVESIHVPFKKFAQPADNALFAPGSTAREHDDDDFPIHLAAYKTLMSLSLDTRALCISRLVVTGGVSKLPGLKRRFLQELAHLVESRCWNPVFSYGSAKSSVSSALTEISINTNLHPSPPGMPSEISLSPTKMPLQEFVRHADRVHDDIQEPITLKLERDSTKGKAELVKSVVRGVQTLGAWAGASLVASLRIKGVHDVDREEFQAQGLRNDAADL